jgi:hypothetical protein
MISQPRRPAPPSASLSRSRPAVTIVLAFVTSREPDELLDTDVVIDPQDQGFAQTGLQVRSTIRIHRLLTVASSIIKRELGTLSPSLQARVADAAHRLFELPGDVSPEESPGVNNP